MKIEDHDFVTSDGVRLHYMEAGRGEPSVFVPGWRMPASIWEHQLDFFAESHRVIALDPRGHGDSEPATEGFHRVRRARDVQELLEAASVETAVLVGWSMGVGELLTYVQEFGTARIRALGLVDWHFRIGDELRALLGGFALRYLRDPETVARELLPTFFSSPQDEDWLEGMIRASLRIPTSSAVALLLEYVAEGVDWSNTLQELDRPLLYAVTPAVTSDVEKLGQLVPDAVIRVFDGAKHGFFFDRHEEFNQMLLEFVESLR